MWNRQSFTRKKYGTTNLHTAISCESAKACSTLISAAGGLLFELGQGIGGGFTGVITGKGTFSIGDVFANLKGLKCSGNKWASLSPIGSNPLPCESCYDCCARNT